MCTTPNGRFHTNLQLAGQCLLDQLPELSPGSSCITTFHLQEESGTHSGVGTGDAAFRAGARMWETDPRGPRKNK